MTDPAEILKAARSILLIDWRHQSVPRKLVEAGYCVFSHSPDGAQRAALVDSDTVKDLVGSYPPEAGERGTLMFEPVTAAEVRADLAYIFRPAEELEAIVEELVMPSGALTVWLQPPILAGDFPSSVLEQNLNLIEGADILDVLAQN